MNPLEAVPYADPAAYIEPSDELKAAAERQAQPSTQRTPGLFVCRPGTATIWSANGDTLVGECKSRHLCHAGNVANAAYLSLAPSMEALIERLIPLVDPRDDDARAAVEEAAQLLSQAQNRAIEIPLERAA